MRRLSFRYLKNLVRGSFAPAKSLRTQEDAMSKAKFVVLALLILAVALPAFGKTYKSTYPVACSQVWPAVKTVLGVQENYTVDQTDDATMTAAYDVKHQAHVNISGAILQRKNKVTLVTEGTGCQMQVVSNYSGWEHNDQGDFKKRVDDALANPNAKPPSAPPQPAEASASPAK